MAIRIAHASSDERGKYRGGKAGDQTGKEICIRSWYNRPWNVIIRFKDPKKRELVAQGMERLAANDNIGYDQDQRNTALAEARKVGYDPAKIKKPCETDCSAAVVIASCYAGIKESALFSGGNSAYTGNLKSKLVKTGEVETFTSSRYVASDSELLRGDILLYEGHHVAVALDNGSNASASSVIPTRILKKGMTGSDVRWLQESLNKLMKANLVVDGDFGNNTLKAVKDFQEKYGLEVDGEFGPKSKTAMNKLLGGEKIVVKKIPALAKPTLRQGSKGTQVRLLQEDLNYVMGTKLNIDGDFGEKTGSALRSFQAKFNLEIDRIYGPESSAMMKKKLI